MAFSFLSFLFGLFFIFYFGTTDSKEVAKSGTENPMYPLPSFPSGAILHKYRALSKLGNTLDYPQHLTRVAQISAVSTFFCISL